MHKLEEIIVILILLVVFGFLYDNYTSINTEGFRNNSQNQSYTNKFNIANNLEYPNTNVTAIYKNPDYNMNAVIGPSTDYGQNENSKSDTFDKSGYKWTKPEKNPEVDHLTYKVDNTQLMQNFERTYMLDPDGSVAQNDITNNKISPNCCPAQYAPPFPLTKNGESNCDYVQEYVANNYSGMNFKDGYGCVCMTPKQAQFFGNRGGNTE